jgi:hypothetical protein
MLVALHLLRSHAALHVRTARPPVAARVGLAVRCAAVRRSSAHLRSRARRRGRRVCRVRRGLVHPLSCGSYCSCGTERCGASKCIMHAVARRAGGTVCGMPCHAMPCHAMPCNAQHATPRAEHVPCVCRTTCHVSNTTRATRRRVSPEMAESSSRRVQSLDAQFSTHCATN